MSRRDWSWIPDGTTIAALKNGARKLRALRQGRARRYDSTLNYYALHRPPSIDELDRLRAEGEGM